MTKQEWLDAAPSLGQKLRNSLDSPVGKSIAKEYTALRNVLFSDRHHDPEDVKGKVLQETFQGWVRDVNAGKYDAKFS